MFEGTDGGFKLLIISSFKLYVLGFLMYQCAVKYTSFVFKVDLDKDEVISKMVNRAGLLFIGNTNGADFHRVVDTDSVSDKITEASDRWIRNPRLPCCLD